MAKGSRAFDVVKKSAEQQKKADELAKKVLANYNQADNPTANKAESLSAKEGEVEAKSADLPEEVVNIFREEGISDEVRDKYFLAKYGKYHGSVVKIDIKLLEKMFAVHGRMKMVPGHTVFVSTVINNMLRDKLEELNLLKK